MLHELRWTIANFISGNTKVKEIKAENQADIFLLNLGTTILEF